MKQITINNNGLVSLSFNEPLHEIYTFVHDTSEPNCNHFNNQSDIQINNEQDDNIVFTKQYTRTNTEITLQHSIQKKSDEFIWEINRKISTNELNRVRFGITIPLNTFSIEDTNGLILTPIINFQQQWQSKYSDQTNIDLPILRIGTKEPLIICSPITNDVQFFKFKENNIEYLKISTKTGDELNLTLHLLPDKKLNLKQIYCQVFPERKNYVYQSELLKRKIYHRYNVRVLSHEIVNTVEPPDADELESYMKLLEKNLDFYPNEMFKNIELKTISLCGHMANETEILKGYSESGGILLNASHKIGYYDRCKTIHHEIFHRIENVILQQNDPEKLQHIWNQLPIEDSFTKQFKGIQAITHPNEYRCELFAMLVLDPRFIQQLENEDSIVRQKIKIVKTIFGRLSPECKKVISNHGPNTENTLIHISEIPHSKEPVETKNRLIIGIKHSCWANVSNVLKISQDTIMINNASQIPEEMDLAYVTINPLDFCAIEYIKYQIPVENSLLQWIDIHTKLENEKSVIKLKNEDILKFNMYPIKEFLKGSRANFEVDKLWNIHEEIRPYNLNSVPFLKQIWTLFRNNPIITRVGYNSISCEE